MELVIELLFCLPMANGHLERVFLALNSSRIIDVLASKMIPWTTYFVYIEGPSLSNWHAARAVDLWWRDKVRRVNHDDSHSEPGPLILKWSGCLAYEY